MEVNKYKLITIFYIFVEKVSELLRLLILYLVMLLHQTNRRPEDERYSSFVLTNGKNECTGHSGLKLGCFVKL